MNKQQTTSILKHGLIVDKLIAEKTGTKIEQIGTPDSQDNVTKAAAGGTTGKYIAKILEQKEKEAESVDLSDNERSKKELKIMPESTVTSMVSKKSHRRKSKRKSSIAKSDRKTLSIAHQSVTQSQFQASGIKLNEMSAL